MMLPLHILALSVTPISSAFGVNATAANPTPGPAAVAALSNPCQGREAVGAELSLSGSGFASTVDLGPTSPEFESTLDPATGVDAATGADLADPSLPVAANFEAEVSSLEAEWARDGISMNATTFFIAAFNSIPFASSSVSSA